ncbi:MAG: hypothetical protein NVSMB30_13410 [Hymenobacter sp.]
MNEVEARQASVAPLPFPDLSLTVSYADALLYAQARLKMLGSGELKPFCEAQAGSLLFRCRPPYDKQAWH